MISLVDAERFCTIFKGKNNTYVRNELPKEKPEAGQKIKTNITNNEGTVDKFLMAHHLDGDFGVGVCPVNAEGKCYYGVIDIDYYQSEINNVLDIIREYSLPLLPFRSKSGGLHVYFMLSKAVSAKVMRAVLKKVIDIFSLDVTYGKTKVEIFPKQEKAEGFGSSVTLPYFNCEKPYTYLLDLYGSPMSFKEALTYIQKHLSSIEAMKEALSNLPYNDAPPCIQKILLSTSVGDEDSGRNNFLFSFAIYARKKYGSGFEKYVEEINETFKSPLDDTTIEQICSSVRDNEYCYKCKDIPCNGFCDKTECKNREFGLGKNKGHFTGIDYGQLYRYMSAEPYYVWKLRLQGQENWVDVIFKDESYLLDQRNFAKMCVRYLNRAPAQVSPNDWYNILNTVLPYVQDVEVKEESDTSSLSALKQAFIRYLSNKQARRDSPYQIRVGLCVRQEINGVATYYFTHMGFAEFLRNQRINFDATLMRETLKGFGAKEDTLTYTNVRGEIIHFPCWSKIEDHDIDDAYAGAMEIEDGDKAGNVTVSVSDADNTEDAEPDTQEKPYTQGDVEDVKDLL